jgi:hypothetical protein
MLIPWVAYCGPWEWPHHFQCTLTSHARYPACAYISLSCSTVYIYFLSTSKDDQSGIRFLLCVCLFFVFCHVCLDVIFPSFGVILFSNFFVWVFKEPAENAILCRGMFLSPPKPFKLPRMLVPWWIALLRRSPHPLLAFVISRVRREIFFC